MIKYLIIVATIFTSCKYHQLETCYSVESGGKKITEIMLNLSDSTFIQRNILHMGEPFEYRGKIVFLSKNRIKLVPRESHISEIEFPDTLDSNDTFLEVLYWNMDTISNQSLKDQVPYPIYVDGAIIGFTNNKGHIVLQLDKDCKALEIVDERARISSNHFQGKAWRILITPKPIFVEKSFYYKIKDKSLESRVGIILKSCP